MNGMIKFKTLVGVFVFGLLSCFLGMEILGSFVGSETNSFSEDNRTEPNTARIIQPILYRDAMKKADFVVIASAFQTKDTNDRFTLKKVFINDDLTEFINDNLNFNLIGQETKFQTAVVLKGEKKTKEFTLLHFRMKPGAGLMNGPSLVKFRLQKKEDINSEIDFGYKYMLFLKKRKDGRYEPLGNIDSALVIQKLSSAE